jgi:hypothetical protein
VSFQRLVNHAPAASRQAEKAVSQADTKRPDAKENAPTASQPVKAKEAQQKFAKVGDFIPVNAVQGAVMIPPALTAMNIRAAPAGSKLQVVIYGQNLDGVSKIIVDDPGIKAKITEIKELPRPKLNRIKFNTGAEIVDGVVPMQIATDVTIGYEARAGFHELRVRNARGASTGILFFVEDLSEVPEHEPNDDIAHAQLLTRGAVAVGAINTIGDVDIYKFDARAGESYVFETVGSSLGSSLTGSLTVTKADGRVLARSEDFGDSADARLAFQARESGTYYISMADRQMMAGGFYRLRVADRAAVTDIFPLGVQAGKEVELAIEGYGLHGVKTLKVSGTKQPAWGQDTAIPADGRNGGALTQLKLGVGEFPEVIETEPNDDAAKPQAVTAPCTINGRIWHEDRTADADVYRFAAKKGQPLIVDVMARRIGSDLDSFIEILDAKGERIERATLRAVAKTMTVLADRDSKMPNIRLEIPDDLQVRDYLMIGNDLMRISRLPGYADEDTVMYSSRGQRLGFLGSTPEHHAVNSDVYKVEVHPPGSAFPANGMPVFHLYVQNDDGGPTYGKDSSLTFDPPADGEYLVRIRSAAGEGDRRFTYRLAIRPPHPEFTASIAPADINLPVGQTTLLTASAVRLDNFNGPIHVKLADLPKGLTANEIDILPGEETAFIALRAGSELQETDFSSEWQMRMIATARIDGREVTHDARLRRISVVGIKPDVELSLEPVVARLNPGGFAEVTVHVTRNNGFAGRVQIETRNLPFGTDIANRGLNGILITENETSRTFRITSLPWTAPMERVITIIGEPATTGRATYLYAAPPIRLQIGPARPQVPVAGKIAQK